MKKIYKFAVVLLWIISMIVILPSNVYGQKKIGNYDVSHNNSIFDQDPVRTLDSFYNLANNNWSNRVQRTDLDTVTSRACTEAVAGIGRTFTITRTLCNIKASIGDYLQYFMYIGLSLATILLIWNGFKLVTSSDREKQMTSFKKNLIYIIIWVVLLVSFYYIIDIFISIINLIAE